MLLMSLFTEVLSAIDCKNTYKSNKTFFRFLSFLIFCWEIIVQKIRVLAFITISAVLFFFFAYRSAEGDESVSFESSSCCCCFYLKKNERRKNSSSSGLFFLSSCFREKKIRVREDKVERSNEDVREREQQKRQQKQSQTKRETKKKS